MSKYIIAEIPLQFMADGGIVQEFSNPMILGGMQNTVFNEKFGRGGVPTVHIVNQGIKYDKQKYPGITTDFDGDGIGNPDDPHPVGPGDVDSIESVSLAKSFNKLLEKREVLDENMKSFVKKLKSNSPKDSTIYARTKTPYSILKKLIDKKIVDLKDPTSGLTDTVGTTIAVQNYKQLRELHDDIMLYKYGKVLDYDDYYTKPLNGYMAYHFILSYNGYPVELQLKTERQKAVNILMHDAYKNGPYNVEYALYLTRLAHQADLGKPEKIKEFNDLIQDPKAIKAGLVKA